MVEFRLCMTFERDEKEGEKVGVEVQGGSGQRKKKKKLRSVNEGERLSRRRGAPCTWHKRNAPIDPLMSRAGGEAVAVLRKGRVMAGDGKRTRKWGEREREKARRTKQSQNSSIVAQSTPPASCLGQARR